jgi:hypothetical protein
MNTQIKLLAEQAGIQEDLVDHLKDEVEVLTYIARPQDIQKFAELIVEECVRHFNEDYQRDFDTNWREDLSKSIKQHFGVEE